MHVDKMGQLALITLYVWAGVELCFAVHAVLVGRVGSGNKICLCQRDAIVPKKPKVKAKSFSQERTTMTCHACITTSLK